MFDMNDNSEIKPLIANQIDCLCPVCGYCTRCGYQPSDNCPTPKVSS